MSRNILSYHSHLISFLLLLALLPFFAGGDTLFLPHASSSRQAHASIHTFSLPLTKRLDAVHYTSAAVSSNYAGYAAQQRGSANFSTVTSSWRMPAISCAPKETAEVAFWTGLTGNQSRQNTIAQIAALGSCQNGKALYEADWELFPAIAQTITYPLQPGDMISATVSYQNGQFSLMMHDAQQGWSFSVSQKGKASNATVAECITEAPTLIHEGAQRSITYLANFGQVNMSCRADGTPIGNYSQLSQYQMFAENATATTSELDSSGADFHVTWQKNGEG